MEKLAALGLAANSSPSQQPGVFLLTRTTVSLILRLSEVWPAEASALLRWPRPALMLSLPWADTHVVSRGLRNREGTEGLRAFSVEAQRLPALDTGPRAQPARFFVC